MPLTQVHFYREDADVPVLDWLVQLYDADKKAAAECVARINLLSQFGHELRRPHADYLRDGIYELRVKRGRVNYRILYFFHGRNVALLAHGLTNEKAVPAAEIERALKRKRNYEQNPQQHRAVEWIPHDPQDLRRR